MAKEIDDRRLLEIIAEDRPTSEEVEWILKGTIRKCRLHDDGYRVTILKASQGMADEKGSVKGAQKGEAEMRVRVRYMGWVETGSGRKRMEREVVGEVLRESARQIVVMRDGDGMTTTIRKANVTGREAIG